MKLFLGRCLTAWLALVFSVPALPQTVTEQITPVQIQEPTQGSGSTSQSTTLQGPGSFSLTPSPTVKPPANTTLTVSNTPSGPGTWGVKGQLTTICGGFNPNGTAQAPCAPVPAHFESEAVGGCPAGTFLGIGTKTCWSCPAGYTRTVHPLTGPRACSRPDNNVREQTFTARFISKKACPAGSFFDPLNEGACWTCPEGYRRSATLVTAPDACVAGAGANRQETFAEVLRDNGCQPGEIHDPRNGGECWACPTGSLRTANPITGERACRIPPGIAFAGAQDEGPKQCAPGQVFDLARSTNAHVGNRIRAQFNNRVPPELEKTLGTNNGTCWTCPPGSKRRGDAVWSDKACGGSLIDMQPAPYEQPGLFRLDGGEEVALAVINERSMINSIARAMADEVKQPAEKFTAAIWDEIGKVPQTSPVLLMAVYARVNEAAINPGKATPAELRLVRSFAAAIQSHRVYLAQTALDAYNTWDKAQAYYKSQTTSTITSAFDLGKPPDFTAISAEAIGIAAGVNVLPSAALTSVYTVPQIKKIVFPHRRAKQKSTEEAQKALQERLQRRAEKAAARAAARAATKGAEEAAEEVAEKLTAKIVLKLIAEGSLKAGMAAGTMLAMSAGPQIIVGLIVELIQFGAEQAIAVAYAKPKLEAGLAQAKAPVDVARMLATEKGADEVDSQWVTTMNSLAAPRALAQIASAAAAGAVAAQAQNTSRFAIVANDGRCLTPQQGSAALAACGAIRWTSSAEGATLQVADSNQCLTAAANNSTISVSNCTNPRATNQTWQFNKAKGWIASTATQRCLDVNSTGGVVQNVCDARDPSSPTQRWVVRQ